MFCTSSNTTLKIYIYRIHSSFFPPKQPVLCFHKSDLRIFRYTYARIVRKFQANLLTSWPRLVVRATIYDAIIIHANRSESILFSKRINNHYDSLTFVAWSAIGDRNRAALSTCRPSDFAYIPIRATVDATHLMPANASVNTKIRTIPRPRRTLPRAVDTVRTQVLVLEAVHAGRTDYVAAGGCRRAKIC